MIAVKFNHTKHLFNLICSRFLSKFYGRTQKILIFLHANVECLFIFIKIDTLSQSLQ